MDTNTQNEIVDTEAIEIKALSLVDATIKTAKASFAELVKESSVDKKARELKSQLKKLTIADVNDKENYTKVKAISKDASKIRIAIEKRRKELKADIILAGKNIDTLANEYQELINPIENEADLKLKIIDDAIEEEKLKAEREAQEKLDNRIKTLIENGIVFTGSWYSINEIQVGIQMIQEIPDNEFEDLLSKVKIQNNLNIAETKRLADEAKLEAEKQENIRKENERVANELKEKEDALNAKMKLIADQEKAIADKQKEQEELDRKQKEYEQEVAIGQKMSRYENLGMKYIYVRKRLEWVNSVGEIVIPKETFIDEPPTLYEETVTAINKFSKEEDDAIEQSETQKRLDERWEKRKEILTELGFVPMKAAGGTDCWGNSYAKLLTPEFLLISESDETFNRLEQSWKERIAVVREAERQALLDDQQKFGEYIEKLKAIPAPTVTNVELQTKINNITKAINQ